MVTISISEIASNCMDFLNNSLDDKGCLFRDLRVIKRVYDKIPKDLIRVLCDKLFIGYKGSVAYYNTLCEIVNSMLKIPPKKLSDGYSRFSHSLHDSYLRIQSFIESLYKCLDLYVNDYDDYVSIDVFRKTDRRLIIDKLRNMKSKYICLTKLISPIAEYRNSITHINFAQEYSCDFLMVLMCVKFYELFFESNDSQNLVYNLIGDVYLREENFLCARKSQIF